MKNVVKIFGIPMPSLRGVHLISGIAHSDFKWFHFYHPSGYVNFTCIFQGTQFRHHNSFLYFSISYKPFVHIP